MYLHHVIISMIIMPYTYYIYMVQMVTLLFKPWVVTVYQNILLLCADYIYIYIYSLAHLQNGLNNYMQVEHDMIIHACIQNDAWHSLSQ